MSYIGGYSGMPRKSNKGKKGDPARTTPGIPKIKGVTSSGYPILPK
jgi:hypothetical protein